MRATQKMARVWDEGLGMDDEATELLGAAEERSLLCELGKCKSQFDTLVKQLPGYAARLETEGPLTIAQFHSADWVNRGTKVGAKLEMLARRFKELRGRLAMANMRLVAHVAKRFRDRGVSYVDLLQEGFCGLLEAIDRFDLNHETKLATYATWWIRQAMQRIVAASAYPVRLSPRHLRQLAQNQENLNDGGMDANGKAVVPEMISRIHTATRPTVSLDANLYEDGQFNLLQTMSDPDGERIGDVDMDETIDKLMENLRPREKEVLFLRYGLGGNPKLSLSQVGKALSVSKERVRQIQDRALEKLRSTANELNLEDSLVGA